MNTNVKTAKVLATLNFANSDEFRDHIIAQDDDCNYSESGWVAVVQGKVAAIARYSHCSCYGTWTALRGGGYSSSGGEELLWSWIGTVDGLVELAKTNADPSMPERTANPDDYEYDHLQKVYAGILAWDAKRKSA